MKGSQKDLLMHSGAVLHTYRARARGRMGKVRAMCDIKEKV